MQWTIFQVQTHRAIRSHRHTLTKFTGQHSTPYQMMLSHDVIMLCFKTLSLENQQKHIMYPMITNISYRVGVSLVIRRTNYFKSVEFEMFLSLQWLDS